MKEYAVVFHLGEFPVTASMKCETDEEAVRCAKAIGAMNGWPVAVFHERKLLKALREDDRITTSV